MGDEKIEKVSDFKYLGSQITSTINDIKSRKAKAWSTFWSLKKLWSSKDINLNLKLNLFQSTCLSIFLYGCETWTIDQKIENIINRFPLACYRYILKIRFFEHERNEEILKKVGQSQLVETVRLRQLIFLGNCLRQTNNIIAKKLALYEPAHGNNKLTRM